MGYIEVDVKITPTIVVMNVKLCDLLKDSPSYVNTFCSIPKCNNAG